MEEDLYMTFTIQEEIFGELVTTELVEGGSNIFVNQGNKEEYVQLMIDYWLNEQCEEQFTAFKRGFDRTVKPSIMELFRPEELYMLICGSGQLDFKELEQACHYVDGFTEESQVVKWLWEVVLTEMTDN
jgi:ubiquitin-protein ligase E3 A